LIPDLSVLVASIHTRYRNFGLAIQDQLFSQYLDLTPEDRKRVEVMVLTDTKSLSIGHKRNALVHAATGRYVVFVDDDDRVSDSYIAALLAATEFDTDVICFNSSVTLDGGPPRLCRFSMQYGHDFDAYDEYLRIPNHLCAVRRVLAREVRWGDIDFGEDRDYSTRLLPYLHSEHRIDQVLYHYDYNRETSESIR
jgi:glycosyltransferase involved in cell wall biosynthesis